MEASDMAATTSGGGRARGGITGINVTPMVDVVLVLLVIMMVSATYIVSQSMKVDLPKTASSDDTVASLAAVTITKDGATLYNNDKVTEAQLKSKLESAYKANNDLNLIVSADRSATHGAVVHVMDLAKVIGITKFAINVEKSE
jgi:biopolymer transport protein ExbD